MSFRTCLFAFAVSLSAACIGVESSSAAEGWQAGTAKVNITPTKAMWMSGYGARDKPAEGKLTDLWAKALVLQDPTGQQAVLVTMDLVGIDRGISTRVCAQIMEKHKLPREAIALACSHTHTGPVVGDNLRSMYFYDDAQAKLVSEYTQQLEQMLVAVVGEALQQVQPAKLSWGNGKATFAVNRRNNVEGEVPKLIAEGKLKGPVDHDLPVLVVQDAKDQLQAIVFGYACHATVLSFYQWSGDWPGFAQIELEKSHPGAMALFFAGCGADQNPLPRRQVPLAEGYGKQAADGVDAVLKSGQLKPIEGKLALAYAEIELPFARVPTREELEKTTTSKDKYEAARAKHLLGELERDGKIIAAYPYPVQTWQLGNGPTLITLGGEVVVDFSLRLKAELGADSHWVAGYANDVMAYIPSRRVLTEGGYEGASAMIFYGLPSPWTPDVEERIVNEVHRQIATIDAREEPADKGAMKYTDHSDLSFYYDEQGEKHSIKTADDWAQRRKHIILGIEAAMGKFPDTSNPVPLDVQETTREEEDGYTRIQLSYVPEPGDRVPAHLYLPKGIKPGERRPAMLALHPTSPIGKRVVAGEGERENRAYGVELAQRGYIVLAPDYPSFGDYKDYNFAADRYVSGSMKGIINHLRGVDLLCAREDVDPERIGTIGHSLGGHNSIFVATFDPRIKVTVSSCGWTPFHDYYGGKIAGWTSDRYVPRIRDVYGLDPGRVPFDYYEMLAALAPRAFFSCSPTRDSNFDVAGVKKCIPKVAEIYKLLGAEDQLVVRYPEAEHDFPNPTRTESYEFIDKVLKFTPIKK